ncbi:HNH endonuclease [Natrinema versiforme]|uniref:HNH endonuclease n=1 Tax=Natrinema versiforme JCM 10478 TaxID=1227496 RepID=L9Y5C8_9EURY|nr:HNH endonuclease signature motif containing protein [Natrinema versiforme]ELY68927.1 HNH endonuclease [Natrinema versiforme JCM 10478]
MGENNVSSSAGYPTPHDNTCDECGFEWRSRGTPAACPECSADMPAHGTCIDLFDRARGVDETPVGEDAVADLDREMDRRLVGDRETGLFDGLTDAEDDYYKERRSYQHSGERDGPEFRGRFWQVQREKALERDRRCQSCGIDRRHYQEFRGYDLDVHHIVPEKEFESAVDAHALENLITLCKDCHGHLEGVPRKKLVSYTEYHDWLDNDE